MENPNQESSVRLHDVVFDTNRMILYGRQSKLLSVEKKNIRSITLKHGFQSERPIAQIIFGIIVLGLGVYFLAHLILHTLVYRIIYGDDLLSILLFPLGGWFIVDGFRKRLYFDVALVNDRRKFPLGKNPDKGELQKFIKIASQFGYSIDATVLDKNILD
jgi:hypothetical protein